MAAATAIPAEDSAVKLVNDVVSELHLENVG